MYCITFPSPSRSSRQGSAVKKPGGLNLGGLNLSELIESKEKKNESASEFSSSSPSEDLKLCARTLGETCTSTPAHATMLLFLCCLLFGKRSGIDSLTGVADMSTDLACLMTFKQEYGALKKKKKKTENKVPLNPGQMDIIKYQYFCPYRW